MATLVTSNLNVHFVVCHIIGHLDNTLREICTSQTSDGYCLYCMYGLQFVAGCAYQIQIRYGLPDALSMGSVPCVT